MILLYKKQQRVSPKNYFIFSETRDGCQFHERHYTWRVHILGLTIRIMTNHDVYTASRPTQVIEFIFFRNP